MLAANAKPAPGSRTSYLPLGFAGGRRAAAEDFAQDDILSVMKKILPNKPKLSTTGREDNVSWCVSTSVVLQLSL